MLFAHISQTMITPCKPSRRILAVRKGAEVLILPAVPMPSQHVAIEVLLSVGAFKGASCYGAFEGSIMRFDVFAVSASQCVPIQVKRWRVVAQTYLYLCCSENGFEQCGQSTGVIASLFLGPSSLLPFDVECMRGAGKGGVKSLRGSEDEGSAIGESVKIKESVDQDLWNPEEELSSLRGSESAPQKSAGKSELVKACSLLSKSN